jgi:hypothetical protein
MAPRMVTDEPEAQSVVLRRHMPPQNTKNKKIFVWGA